MSTGIAIVWPASARHERRFWAKVDKSGDCWLWTASLQAKGYGQFGHKGKMWLAHRISYAIEHGSVPAELVDHTCFVHHCVRPSHLRLATCKQNSENRAGAQQNSKSGVRGVYWDSGTGRWRAKVTHGSKTIHIGRFDSVVDATAAVEAARRQFFTHNELDRKVA